MQKITSMIVFAVFAISGHAATASGRYENWSVNDCVAELSTVMERARGENRYAVMLRELPRLKEELGALEESLDRSRRRLEDLEARRIELEACVSKKIGDEHE